MGNLKSKDYLLGLLVIIIIGLVLFRKAGDPEDKIKVEIIKKTSELKDKIIERQQARIKDYIIEAEQLSEVNRLLADSIKNIEVEQVTEIRYITKFTERQADSAIVANYPDKETRSKEIIIDLTKGRQAIELAEITKRQVIQLVNEVALKEKIIVTQDSIIGGLQDKEVDLKALVSNYEEENKTLSKKLKRQIWAKRLIGVLGVVALVL